MNRSLIILLFVFVGSYATAQIRVPKNFYLVKGASNAGRDDYYTDGQYKLYEETPFRADHPNTDSGILRLLYTRYKVDFSKLRKGFYSGTGYSNHEYKSIVIAKGFAFIVSSKVDNDGLKNYSKWLLNQIGAHWNEGDELYFKK